ncbi:hypothetical protein ACFYV7_39405 [Nocardia suismassiliense]|uniref:Excreted virulence factor EspC, type VII ESX diderm n=1 Tax=Nocardia suismassiliense TaxID=2077092 RepID=A0ABW6R5V9_9NOCA
MDKRGTAFGVYLYQLERVAKVDFPAVSGDYGFVIGNCDRVRGAVEQAMLRPEYFGGDTLGPVYRAYLDLHDAMVGHLKETRTNLDDTGVALAKAARHFADTDRAAAADMNWRKSQDDELKGK